MLAWRAVAQPLALGIPYGVAIWWFANSHTPWGWLGLAVEMGLAALIYLVIAWLLVSNESERQRWSYRIKMLSIPKR